jgi:hypothetical protein
LVLRIWDLLNMVGASSPLTCSPYDSSRRAGEDLGEGEIIP